MAKTKKSTKQVAPWLTLRGDLLMLLALLGAGATLGLAAPGYEQWYLAWFGLIPLFLTIYAQTGALRRFGMGLAFGLGYNLIYLSWYLNLLPLDWLGFAGVSGFALAGTAWLVVSMHQALLYGLFAWLSGLIMQKRAWPAILLVPTLFVLIVNRLGNWPDLMGVPWSMLEYTQYKQTSIIQSASVIGGIGLEWLIVAVNTTLACLIATFLKQIKCKPLVARSRELAYYQGLGMVLLYGACIVVGLLQQESFKTAPDIEPRPITIVQGDINIDMQKSKRKYKISDLTEIYDGLLKNTRDSLVILTESALPIYLNESPNTRAWLEKTARDKHIDIITGAMDKDNIERPMNGAFATTSSGAMISTVYHKQFLVPFGEYTPWLINYMPQWLKQLTNTPAGGGFAPGREAISFTLNGQKVSPLICFESISPDLVARSVREGGQLLVNISDLAWFHQSNCGKQMMAFAVLRAVENRRHFVFAANSGPSAIISQSGKIVKQVGQDAGQCVLSGEVTFDHRLSPFTLWYR